MRRNVRTLVHHVRRRPVHAGVALGLAAVLFFVATQSRAATSLTTCGALTTAGETYVLTQDVVSDKTCFVIKNDNITLDLNGHTVTYGNAPEVGVNSGFEQGTGSSPTGWDLSSAPQAARVSGPLAEPITVFTGQYSLRFDLGPGTAEQTVRTSSSVTLEANTTYALTAMVHNVVSDSVTATVELDGTAYSAQHAGITWRGFQLVYVIFRPTTTVTAPITVRMSGAGLTTDGNVYVDDVSVRPARYYGVAIPTYDNGRLPDIDVASLPSGNPDNITIKNGTITQGAGNGFEGHAVYFVEGVFDVEIDTLAMTVQGPESSVVFAEWSHSNTIHHSTFTSNVQALVSRDNFSAAMLNIGRTRGGNSIYQNTFLNGPHAGIMMGDYDGSSPGGSQMYENTFRMKSRHTNGFAIAGGDRNGSVHDNTILNVDGYYGRGIHAGNGTTFSSNHIEVSDVPTNQEYDGCQPPGVYGVQVEEGSGTVVTGNTIIARTGAGLCNAMALRFTSPVSGVAITSNVVTAIDASSADAYRAYALSYSRGDGDAAGDMSDVPLTSNTFTSNSSWFYFGYYSPSSIGHVRAVGNTFNLGADPVNFIAMHGVSTPDVLFRDNQYGSAAARTALEGDSIRWSSSPDPNSDFTIAWSYNPTVTTSVGDPMSGATVTIHRDGSLVFSGTTGVNGKLASAALLPEFTNAGGARTTYSPYAVSIAKTGFTPYGATFSATAPVSSVIVLADSGGVSGCTESWSCTAWSACTVGGTQTRTCTDANACGTTTSKPAEIQSCTPADATPPATITNLHAT